MFFFSKKKKTFVPDSCLSLLPLGYACWASSNVRPEEQHVLGSTPSPKRPVLIYSVRPSASPSQAQTKPTPQKRGGTLKKLIITREKHTYTKHIYKTQKYITQKRQLCA